MSTWLELTKTTRLNGEDERVWINFELVIQIDWVAARNVSVLVFAPGYRVEVRQEPEAILRLLEPEFR